MSYLNRDIYTCAYCGDLAVARDHVVSQAYRKAMGMPNNFSKNYTVPSCKECNSTLRDLELFTIGERAEYLLGKYTEKYKKLLNAPKWSEEELSSMGENMRAFVKYKAAESDYFRLRIENLKEASGMHIGPIQYWERISK